MNHQVAQTEENFKAPEELASWQSLSLGIGVIGIVALFIGGFFNTEQALRSYLIGYVFWAGIGIGCLGVLILQHLTGGSWGLVIRRILEAGAKTLPLLAVLFVPILLGATNLYEWAAYPTRDDHIIHKALYLNYTFFGIRAIIYFGMWSLIAFILIRWSRQQDETGDWKISDKMNSFSAPALIGFVVAVSFAAIDWVMSLDVRWFSTIYGLLFVIGWALSCIAFVIALSAWLSQREPMNQVLGAPHFHDLGKLMLAFVMVWAYFNFSQVLIIWSGNLPEETTWYLRRIEGGWMAVGIVLIIFHFVFPFLLLLSRDLKRQARYLSFVAISVLVMRVIDLFYLIAPNPLLNDNSIKGLTVSWMDIVSPLAVGGLWFFYFIVQFRKRPLMPYNDPFFENAIEHGREHH